MKSGSDPTAAPRRVDRRAPRGLEHRRAIGNAAPRRHVGKIKRRGRDAALGQCGRGSYQKRARLSRPGAVRHDQCREGVAGGVHFQIHAGQYSARTNRPSGDKTNGHASANVSVVCLLLSAAPCFGQRLPGNVTPQHYDIRVEPNLAAAAFDGSVRIKVTLAKPSAAIVLNAAEIEFETVIDGRRRADAACQRLARCREGAGDADRPAGRFPRDPPTSRSSTAAS